MVLRTLDLLNLYYQTECGKLTEATLMEIFKSRTGWLRATREGFEVVEK